MFYRTVNGSAVGGTHFTHKTGMLTFNGSGSQTVTVTEKAVTSTYGGKAATAYTNADRTYSLEIYRPMGGATISTGTAARTMTKSSSHTVDRKVYTSINEERVYSSDTVVNDPADNAADGGKNENYTNLWHSRGSENPHFTRTIPYGAAAQAAYIDNTATGWGYRFSVWGEKKDAGYADFWIGYGEPPRGGIYVGTKGATLNIANQKWSGCVADINASFAAPDRSGYEATLYSSGCSGVVGPDGKEYVLFLPEETAHIHFGAHGSGQDVWLLKSLTGRSCVLDDKEPQLLGIAPMAQTAYAVGDNITIALVFDEIVDVKNSTLDSVKIKTNVAGDLSYSGGGDTNVLYFTGKVTTEFKGGDIQVNGITGASYIKDMCDTAGTETLNKTGSTPITTTGASAPKLTLTNNGVTDGVAKAQIAAQNADLLQYCWTQDAGMPAAGWSKAGGTTYTATNPAQKAGTYYLHAMAIKKATGEAAYEKTSFTVTPQQQQEQENKLVLTEETDNTRWARSRTILLEKKGSGSLILTVKKPDGTPQTVAGNSYTATANGTYTFTLSNGSKTVTKTVAVSKIDRTNPKVTVSAIPTAWQASAPTVTISGTDTNGSGIAGLQYKWVTAKDAYPTSGLTSLGKTGTSVSGAVVSPGLTDGVNYLYYKAVDDAGNTAQGYSSALRLDRITPTITLGAAQVDGPNAIFSVTVTYGPSAGRTVC